MRVLIDECLNWRLGRALTGHYAASAQKMGWSGIKNGHLLALAVENGFDVFLTGDRNLAFQQNLTSCPIAIVVLESDGIQLHHTLPLMPKVLALETGPRRKGVRMSAPAVTLDRLRQLEAVAAAEVDALRHGLVGSETRK